MTSGTEMDERLLQRILEIGTRKVKAQLLAHYATRPPRLFLQLDGFANAPEDDYIKPDADGDVLFCSATVDLMYGASVRVLINPSEPKETVIRVLRKLLDWYETNNFERFGPELLNIPGGGSRDAIETAKRLLDEAKTTECEPAELPF